MSKAEVKEEEKEELSREEQAYRDERIAQKISQLQVEREEEAKRRNIPLQAAPTNIEQIAIEAIEEEDKNPKKEKKESK